MATIRANCTTCGDVEVTSRAVSVRVCRDDNSGAYAFCCPRCEGIVVAGAEPHIVELLVTSGVKLVTWDLPAELYEAHHGDPITHDDLLDFHELMAGGGWMAALERLTTP